VFFVSLLATGRAGRRRMAAAGLAFCAGVFATYVALGFGLLHACRAAEALPVVRFWFRAAMSGMLAVLALVSFRDAVAYVQSGRNAASVKLKLPRRLQEASHRLAKQGVAARWLLPGCAAMGVAVTVVEAVCTGQTYLPALAFMARQGSLRATAMLLAYNLMFVLPLVAILAAACWGGAAWTWPPGRSGKSWPPRSRWACSSRPSPPRCGCRCRSRGGVDASGGPSPRRRPNARSARHG